MRPGLKVMGERKMEVKESNRSGMSEVKGRNTHLRWRKEMIGSANRDEKRSERIIKKRGFVQTFRNVRA